MNKVLQSKMNNYCGWYTNLKNYSSVVRNNKVINVNE